MTAIVRVLIVSHQIIITSPTNAAVRVNINIQIWLSTTSESWEVSKQRVVMHMEAANVVQTP
jgi:hypothetical protein